MVTDNAVAMALLKKYRPLLYKMSKEIKEKCPNLDFDDIFQILSIRLLNSASKLDITKGSEMTYIYSSLFNEQKNIVRSYFVDRNKTKYHNLSFESIKDKDNQSSDVSYNISFGEEKDNYLNPEVLYREKEIQDILEEVRSKLNENNQKVFDMLFQGYKVDFIAKTLNLSLKSIYNRIKMIKIKIKEKL